MAVIVSPNEYKSHGISAIKCDGPFFVLLLALPSLIVYGFGLIVFGELFVRIKNRWRYASLLISFFCFLLITFITPNTIFAFSVYNHPDYKEVCGGKG